MCNLSALNEWNLSSSKAQFHWGIQSVLLLGKKTLTQLTVLKLLSASKDQAAAYIRWWIPAHVLRLLTLHTLYYWPGKY